MSTSRTTELASFASLAATLGETLLVVSSLTIRKNATSWTEYLFHPGRLCLRSIPRRLQSLCIDADTSLIEASSEDENVRNRTPLFGWLITVAYATIFRMWQVPRFENVASATFFAASRFYFCSTPK